MKVHNFASEARLIFAVQSPDLETCWTDGYEIAMASGIESENPYPEHSSEYQQWNDGWWAGFYHEAPLYQVACADLASEAHLSHIQQEEAANEAEWVHPNLKWWASTVAKIVGIVAVAACAIQLADLAA